MTDPIFNDTYGACRAAFLDACAEAGAAVRSHKLPGDEGPDGDGLFIDATLIGDPDAPALLHVTSGIHGVEGPAGSNAQTHWLRTGGADRLPKNVAVQLIHAVNPWGFAHHSRTNENNVDLNRNFLAFPKLPDTPERYGAYHKVFRIDDPSDEGMAAFFANVQRLKEEDGLANFMTLSSGGQYVFQDGLSFGGVKEEWSVATVRQLFDEVAQNRQAVCVIDYHTGFGEYADHLFLMFDPPDSPARARARDWFGAEVIDREGVGPGEEGGDDMPQPDYDGLLAVDLAKRAKPASSTAVVIEFGTVPLMELVAEVVKHNWVRQSDAEATDRGREIVQSYRTKFIPDDPKWRRSVLSLAETHFEQAIQGVSGQIG